MIFLSSSEQPRNVILNIMSASPGLCELWTTFTSTIGSCTCCESKQKALYPWRKAHNTGLQDNFPSTLSNVLWSLDLLAQEKIRLRKLPPDPTGGPLKIGCLVPPLRSCRLTVPTTSICHRYRIQRLGQFVCRSFQFSAAPDYICEMERKCSTWP